jgi:hypothetical protein
MNKKVRLLPHFFVLKTSSNAVLLRLLEKRDAKELKLKANHNEFIVIFWAVEMQKN